MPAYRWRANFPLADNELGEVPVPKYLRLIRLPAARRHRAALKLAAQALKDDRGGEVIEYALVIGLVIVGAIAVITCVGTKVVNRWNRVNSSI